jgi:hypothetical protein
LAEAGTFSEAVSELRRLYADLALEDPQFVSRMDQWEREAASMQRTDSAQGRWILPHESEAWVAIEPAVDKWYVSIKLSRRIDP